MFISIPTDIADETCSEKSEVRVLDDLIFLDSGVPKSHPFTKGMQIREIAGGDIYEYSLNKTMWIPAYKSVVHKEGDIVIRNGHHHIIESATHTPGVSWYKQPEDYASCEETMNNFTKWTQRYFKTSNKGGQSFVSTIGGRTYYMQRVMLNSCGKVGQVWRVRDNTAKCSPADPCTGVVPSCHVNSYFCIEENLAYAFDPAKDIIGEKKAWKANGGASDTTLFFKSVVSRGDYWYFRTYVEKPPEMNSTPAVNEYATRRIYSPKEINGFRYKGKTNCFAAYDDKNYTKAKFNPSVGFVDFTFTLTDWSDTFSLGRVFAQSVSITVFDSGGGSIFNITKYPIQNEIADTALGQSSNVVLYGNTVFPPDSKVVVRLYGGWISVGRVLVGRKLSVGFTNTIFDNGFKDFSPKEQDQWGSIEYKNANRVYTHSGTVELPIEDYDAVLRAFMYIGGREMIINGSDSINNTPPNSITIFQSTMMIGRFTSFKQKTKNVGGAMDNIAGYSFSIEESV